MASNDKITPQGYVYGEEPKSWHPFWEEDGGGSGANIEPLTVESSTAKQTFKATSTVDGYAPVVVLPYEEKEVVINEITITPSDEMQVITAPSGVDGYNPITVEAQEKSEPSIAALDITPSTQQQIINAPSGIDGYNPITVEAYTEKEPVLETITVKSGKLGLNYTPSEGVDGYNEVIVNPLNTTSITVKSTVEEEEIPTVVNSFGYDGYDEVIVNPVIGQSKTVVPTNEEQVITADEGYDALISVKVEAAESSGNANLETLDVVPSTSEQFIDAEGYENIDGWNIVDVAAVDASIDSNIQSSAIISGVSILGVDGAVTACSGSTPMYVIFLDSSTLRELINSEADPVSYQFTNLYKPTNPRHTERYVGGSTFVPLSTSLRITNGISMAISSSYTFNMLYSGNSAQGTYTLRLSDTVAQNILEDLEAYGEVGFYYQAISSKPTTIPGYRFLFVDVNKLLADEAEYTPILDNRFMEVSSYFVIRGD